MSRKTILFVLMALTILYRGSFFIEIFSSSSVFRGIQWSVKDRMLVARDVEQTDPFGRPTAAGWAGIKEGDRIIEILDVKGNSFHIHSLNDLGDALRKIRGTPSASFIVLRPDANGNPERIPLTVKQRVNAERDVEASLLTILWTSLLPLVAITTAFFIGFSKPEDNHAFLACLLFLAFSAIITIDIYLLPPGFRELSRLYETTCVVFLTYLFMRFFLSFPHASWIERKFPWLKTVFLFVTLALLGIRLYSDFALHNSFDRYTRFQELINPIASLLNGLWFAMLGIGVVSLLLNTLRPQSLDERRRMMILLIGVAVGIVLPGILVLYAFRTNSKSILLISAIALLTAAFPAAFAYVVIRHRVLGIQLLVRRGLQYLFISRAFWLLETILVFVALYFLVLPVLMKLLPWTPPFVLTILIGALTLLTYFAIRRINQPIMNVVDRRFFRQAYDAREILTDLSRAVGRFAASPAQLLELVTDRISRALHPDPVAVFLKGYDIAEDEEGKARLFPMKEDRYYCVWIQKATQSVAPSDYAFPQNSFISEQLAKLEEPHALEVYLDDPNSWAHTLMKNDSNEARMVQERDLLSSLGARLMLPLFAAGNTVGFFSLGEKLSEEPYSKEDKNLLLTVADQTAIALHYSKLIAEVADQEKTKREIDVARQVQAQLFPQTFPKVSNLDYVGYCRAARGVGGDYFDFLNLGENILGIGLGDISGKGISAALLMSSLQALLRSNAPEKGSAIDQLFLTMNRLLCASAAKGKYATFFYSVFNGDKRTLIYVNGGHLPPMVFRTGGEVLRLKTGGMVLGMLPQATYIKEEIQLQKDDVLVIFSDGASEAMNIKDEEFGEERIIEFVKPNLHKSAAEIKDVILAGIDQFVAHADQHDDLTLVVARIS